MALDKPEVAGWAGSPVTASREGDLSEDVAPRPSKNGLHKNGLRGY